MAHLVLKGSLPDDRLREWGTNRGGWVSTIEDGEAVLALPSNPAHDVYRGTVAIAGSTSWRDYDFTLEVCFTGSSGQEDSNRGWFGPLFRAQNTHNYELVWFMSHSLEGNNNVAYLSVAHGMVPWWTEAYQRGSRGSIRVRPGQWLPVRVQVRSEQATVLAGMPEQELLAVPLTYYLSHGCVGVYCGTQTTAKFRRMQVELKG